MKRSVLSIMLLAIVGLFSCQDINAQNTKILANRTKSKTAAEWKKILTPGQYEIMVNRGTEPPFHNAYDDNHQKGVYKSS